MSARAHIVELWRPVIGYEDCYAVSDAGRIKSVARVIVRRNGTQQTVAERIRIAIRHKSAGHLQIVLSRDGIRKTHKVHRLVARAFLGPSPEDTEVLHYDGVAANNALSNLRYGTRAENEGDKVRHGVSNRGERSGHAKLTAPAVIEIRQSISAGATHQQIADRFGIRQSQVSRIASGKRWGWLHG